ncbi:MAG: Hint domain-containing protein [Bacilli bacterium]|nr:Hint domain-containing protein [Bacilli bacterium]
MSVTLSSSNVDAIFSGTQSGNAFSVSSSLPLSICLGSKCFKEGTIVKTEEGDKKIEDIKVGDRVLSKNPETGEIAYKKVTKLYRNETFFWFTIFLSKKESITTTLLHVFFWSNGEKRNAFTLKQAANLVDDKGKIHPIKYVKLIHHLRHDEKTYNIEVEDFHTYFVGQSGIWVSG